MWWLIATASAREVVSIAGFSLGLSSGVGFAVGVEIDQRVRLELVTSPPQPSPPIWFTLGARATALGGSPDDLWRPLVSCSASYNSVLVRFDSLGAGCGLGLERDGLWFDIGPTVVSRPGWWAVTQSETFTVLPLPQAGISRPW